MWRKTTFLATEIAISIGKIWGKKICLDQKNMKLQCSTGENEMFDGLEPIELSYFNDFNKNVLIYGKNEMCYA